MIRKYRYGTPFDTEALTEKIETTKGVLPYGEVSQEEGFVFTYIMDEDDIVYGLGEANRGINKRGYMTERIPLRYLAKMLTWISTCLKVRMLMIS